ncbi:MAG: YbhB/YbcL family Raf kinase inhibitor-like protein [Candidatus Omnitrophica bacterium]|nr:YbhB/YbcL family Raf kinase inhibitor-like protein [Candidatus Omnitrophota bacterium]MBU1894413.1 YbhB/YbcL family Raf kinase inhibitor-like protein [Candidatus Omnitrophota bacterium]
MSNDFNNRGQIPQKYTGLGEDISPELCWAGVPDGTKSFVVILDDPDAPVGNWVHWVIYNISSSSRILKRGIVKNGTLSDGTCQGRNSFGKIGYNGPYPPHGPAHRYVFTLYALDSVPNIKEGADKVKILNTIKSHILAQTELMGWYKQ